MPRPRQDILDDEWLIVRNSGEIPEIFLHSALYFLAEDPDGPHLRLQPNEIRSLREAALLRYEEIILRDLCFENRMLSLYRGLRRAIWNWRRVAGFCERQDTCSPHLRDKTAEALRALLYKAEHEPDATTVAPIFNCGFHDITLFARELGLVDLRLPDSLRSFCPEETPVTLEMGAMKDENKTNMAE